MSSYVVVGASRGLGYAWLQYLSADKSNTVIGLARTPAQVDAQLAADGISNVHMLKADMVDHKSLTAAAAEVSTLTNGSVDYLIINGAYMNHKNAGITPTGFTGKEDLLWEEMRQHLDVNVVGVILAINAFLPLVRKSSIKKITVLSSGMADTDLVMKAEIAFGVAYASLKAALNMIVLKYSIELKDEGIILLALSPGVIDTRQETPTEKEIAESMVMAQKFQKIYPNFSGPIAATESVAMQKSVIEEVTIKESGEFLSHLGTKQWL